MCRPCSLYDVRVVFFLFFLSRSSSNFWCSPLWSCFDHREMINHDILCPRISVGDALDRCCCHISRLMAANISSSPPSCAQKLFLYGRTVRKKKIGWPEEHKFLVSKKCRNLKIFLCPKKASFIFLSWYHINCIHGWLGPLVTPNREKTWFRWCSKCFFLSNKKECV